MNSLIYSSIHGSKLRNSDSSYDNAAFLVKWAQELYPYWAHNLENIFASVDFEWYYLLADYKENTDRIADKISELK